MSSTEVLPPSTSDLPTGEPVPSALEPAPKPKPFPFRDLVAALPSNTDAFLAHLQRCLQTPSGIDTTLLFVCYVSRLSAALLETATRPAIQRSASQLLALASSLPPSATLVFSSKALPSSGTVVALALARRLKALSALLSDARTFLRLWGLLGMYFWGRRLVFKWRESRASDQQQPSQQQQDQQPQNQQQPEKKTSSGISSSSSDRLETSIAWAQLLSCVVFQALENGAYLASKGVLGLAPSSQAKAFRWSARFWGTFVGLELGRLWYEAHRRARRTRAERFGGGEKSAAAVEREERDWADAWRKSVVRNLSWFPLTLHWSLEQGLVNELAIGALASIPGYIQMRDLWRRTAE
ncbi:hypothetical protein F5X96DRAFT_438669 [Biscogniauxia mediterranea]|nr:hypothetical protein F5X96DRAFT_438669 [Biscogniauxia mediterranea]